MGDLRLGDDRFASQRELQERMLQSLRHIEWLLSDINGKVDDPQFSGDHATAKILAAMVEANTARLSEITLVPDIPPRPTPRGEGT